MNRSDETALIERCRAGEPAAWDELFDLYYSPAARFVFQLSPGFSKEDTEEICQETFLTVIRTLDSFRGDCQFQTWLFRIAANRARDFRQRQQALKRGGDKTTVSLEGSRLPDDKIIDPPDPTGTPDLELVRSEDLNVVAQAVLALNDPCREIIQLRYFADLSYEEIATDRNMNPKTVSSRLSKCLDKLEAQLKALWAREKSDRFSV